MTVAIRGGTPLPRGLGGCEGRGAIEEEMRLVMRLGTWGAIRIPYGGAEGTVLELSPADLAPRLRHRFSKG